MLSTSLLIRPFNLLKLLISFTIERNSVSKVLKWFALFKYKTPIQKGRDHAYIYIYIYIYGDNIKIDFKEIYCC
jgi:hypothetical protein